MTETASGLKYRILRASSGRKPNPTSQIYVHYQGTLDDGTVFDSSYAHGQPVSFDLDEAISGWTEGLQLIGKGGMIELEVPHGLAYGVKGYGSKIPPGATLHFIIELIEVFE